MALALVVIYGIVQVVNGTGDSERRAARQVAGTPAPPATSARPSTAPPPKAQDPVAVAPRKEVELRVKARSTTWVNIRGDKGKQLFSGLLRQGQSREWKDPKKLSILIGNGGGLRLTVNGEDIGSPGAPGSVYRMSFTPDDPGEA
jgi:hypothetical protein